MAEFTQTINRHILLLLVNTLCKRAIDTPTKRTIVTGV